ncbi:MAG: alpha/beta hydrolase, partial [Anaerolineae bacterium]|nr:alpha/beta hydrolase [Anaerolineae bacterium]
MTGSNGKKRGFSPLLAAVGAVAGAAGGWIIYSSRSIDHDLHLPKAIDAEKQRFLGTRTTRFMNYYADTSAEGRPLVLIHSINAAASAYEMKPIFEHYRGSRPVYALELPGFGFSERSDRYYSYEMFKDAILDFMVDVVKEAADVVALSLSCEFMARAALEAPEHFHSLVMISPSGFT